MIARDNYDKGRTFQFIDTCNAIIKDINNLSDGTSFTQYIYNSLGLAYISIGNIYLSKKNLELAKYHSVKSKDNELNISIIINLGLIELEKGNYKIALDSFLNILITQSNIGSDDKNVIYNNIAFSASKINDTINANYYFNKLQNINEEKEGTDQFKFEIFYRNYGKYLLLQKKYEKSRKFLDKALNECLSLYGVKHYQTAKCYQFLGQLYLSQNKLDSARISYKNAVESMSNKIAYTPKGKPLWITTSYETVFIEILHERGKLFYKIAQSNSVRDKITILNNAVKDCKLAVNRLTYLTHGITDESTRLIISEKGRKVFQDGVVAVLDLFEATKNLEYYDLALLWSMQAKSLSMKWLQEKEMSYDQLKLPEHIILDLARLRARINSYIRTDNQKQTLFFDSLSILIQKYEDKERLIKDEYISISNFQNKNRSVRDLKKLLRNESYLGYFDLDSIMIAFGLNKRQQFYKFLPLDSDKRLIIKEFKDILSNKNSGLYSRTDLNDFISKSSSIYKWFVKPMQEIIKNKRIAIDPDGLLLGLPFGTLIKEDDNNIELKSFRNLQFLFKKNNIRYVTVSLLNENKIGRFNLGRITSCLLTAKKHNSLHGIRNEMRAFARSFPKSSYIYLEDNQRSINKFLEKSDIIHVSSHNTVDYQNPFNSTFTTSNNSNIYKFSFLDILQLGGNYKFVFLNDCESGTGPINIGEGFISMGFAFMLTGTKSVIEHLWNAPEQASSQISQNFYHYLRKLGSVNSLRKAKIDYIENISTGLDHPYFWAGIIYSGQDWKLKHQFWPGYFVIIFMFLTMFYFVFRNRIFRPKLRISSL